MIQRMVYCVTKDIWKDLLAVIAFVLQLCICLNILVGLGGTISTFMHLKKLSQNLTGMDITGFAVKYSPLALAMANTVKEELTVTLSVTGKGYASLENFIRGSERPFYVGMGRFSQAFGFDQYSDTDGSGSVLLIGANVKEYGVGDTIRIGEYIGKAIPQPYVVDGRLDRNTAYIQGTTAYVNLDDAIIWLTTYEEYAQLYPYSLWNVVSNLHLLDADTDTVFNFITKLTSNSAVEVRPFATNERIKANYEDQFLWVRFYSIVFGCALLLVATGFFITLHQILERKQKDYAIHRLYGAPRYEIWLRRTLFLACVLVVPLLWYPLSENASYAQWGTAMPPILLMLPFPVVLTIFTCWEAYRMEQGLLPDYLRRDFE